MKSNYIFFLLVLILGCTAPIDKNLSIGKLPKKTIDAQRELVSVLSGNKKLDGLDYIIRSRTTQEERSISRRYLSEVIKQLNLTPLEQNYIEANPNPLIDLLVNPFKGTNLYTVIPSNSNEYVVLGAHYDTARNCPGANDNASAVALLYGVAKKLLNVTTRHKNVIIVFFDQEEEDLVGSRAFAKDLIKNDYNIHSVHTFDQMGWDKDLDRAIELELPTDELEKLYREQGEKLSIPIHTTRVSSTDHQSFRELGYNAVGITEEFVNGDTTPFKDTIDDTYDTVDLEYLESTTHLVFEVIKTIITQN